MSHLRTSAGTASPAAEASALADEASPSIPAVVSPPAAGAGWLSCGAQLLACFSAASLLAFSLALIAGMIRSASLGLGGLRCKFSKGDERASSWLRLPRPPRLRLDSLRSWPWPALHS